eukprot:8735021-Pyramimonas_sp.AAC.1
MPPGVARLPNGWHHLRSINMKEEIDVNARAFKALPRCIRDSYLRILTQCLAACSLRCYIQLDGAADF